MLLTPSSADHIAKQFPGRDIPATQTKTSQKDGSSPSFYAASAPFLLFDPDNRCTNLCATPLLHGANQVGYFTNSVGDEIQEILILLASSRAVRFRAFLRSLRRRADLSPYFPPGSPQLPQDRLHTRSSRHQTAHRIRQEQGILQAGL